MKLTAIHTGFLKLDGGAMFGIVPRRMWENMNPPDVNNLCSWAMRALLVEVGDRKVLIDTGVGNKQDAKFRSYFEPHGIENMFDSLANVGLARTDITDVFLTHLHFDHCGGALWENEVTGKVELSFPNARYWTNEPHWNWALNPNLKEAGSFLAENFKPLQEMGRLNFIDVEQNVEFMPGFHVRFVYGHTEAMMVPVLETERGTVVYCADTMPARWFIGMPYIMAYDIRPLVTLKEKSTMLEEAVQNNHILFFEHDPFAEACRLVRDDRGRIVAGTLGNLSDLLA